MSPAGGDEEDLSGKHVLSCYADLKWGGGVCCCCMLVRVEEALRTEAGSSVNVNVARLH